MTDDQDNNNNSEMPPSWNPDGNPDGTSDMSGDATQPISSLKEKTGRILARFKFRRKPQSNNEELVEPTPSEGGTEGVTRQLSTEQSDGPTSEISMSGTVHPKSDFGGNLIDPPHGAFERC